MISKLASSDPEALAVLQLVFYSRYNALAALELVLDVYNSSYNVTPVFFKTGYFLCSPS
jgi:hypothetical protein